MIPKATYDETKPIKSSIETTDQELVVINKPKKATKNTKNIKTNRKRRMTTSIVQTCYQTGSQGSKSVFRVTINISKV